MSLFTLISVLVLTYRLIYLSAFYFRFETSPTKYRLWEFPIKWSRTIDSWCNRWKITRETCCWIWPCANTSSGTTVTVHGLYNVSVVSYVKRFFNFTKEILHNIHFQTKNFEKLLILIQAFDFSGFYWNPGFF